jgi:hypothetical protein
LPSGNDFRLQHILTHSPESSPREAAPERRIERLTGVVSLFMRTSSRTQ